uniref:Asparagine synthetase domain-containing protein n=1 Tax=Brassica oleracea var. oleracea TaxID=109376 RepID=A0A0D3E7S2_BRAOL
MAPNAANGFVMGSEHDHDENKQVSEEPLLEDENRDGEHEKILSEDIVIIHSEIHSRSSSSSSSSSSYSSPPKHLPETDSPPVQVMDRDDNSNYDPDRIPSSVFETSKSNLQADWSCASNESLFSIHIGRNSFTVDAMKSGELYKSGELLAYSPELPMPPPPGKESDPLVESKKVVDSDDDDEKEEQPPAVSWKTPTKSYRSNRSSNSTHSFSFPILAGAASDSASVETGEKKKQEKQSEETKPPAEVENQKNSTIFWKVSVNQVIIVEPKKLRSNFRREGDERERETPPEICVGTKRFPITAQRNYSCNPAIGGFVLKHEWRNTMWKELIEWERNLVVPRPEYQSIEQGEKEVVPVAGGLDSMILAALLDQCLDPKYEVDLLNVSFDGANAPDRISAKAGIKELKKIAPLRRYKSEARILLVGAGADEQCAGYGRHRTKCRNGSWVALDQEMKLDMQRIWKRNLGRDDRRIADNGKEARFPFLDEDVIKTLLDIPLWEIADLEQPSGKGDKKILRQVAKLLGLPEIAKMPKRAIQKVLSLLTRTLQTPDLYGAIELKETGLLKEYLFGDNTKLSYLRIAEHHSLLRTWLCVSVYHCMSSVFDVQAIQIHQKLVGVGVEPNVILTTNINPKFVGDGDKLAETYTATGSGEAPVNQNAYTQ